MNTVKRWIDLSRPLDDNLPVYPGDHEFRLIREKETAKDGYTLYSIETGNHAGTHIDGPLHMLETGKLLSEYPPEKFSGQGILLDVRGQSTIHPDQKALDLIEPDMIVLFWTGHSAHHGQPDYFKTFPALSKEYATALVGKKVKMIGLDGPSIDYSPFPAHKTLLNANVLIIEGLYQLESLLNAGSFEVFAFPVRYQADSAPARVMARLD